jgi:hypothetical protein
MASRLAWAQACSGASESGAPGPAGAASSAWLAFDPPQIL